jgi:transketolase
MKIVDEKELKLIANNIRKSIIEEIYEAQSGHPGGALSIADILTVLYFNQMNIDEKDPENNLRDRLVLSKGHASAALYAVLAERGFISKEDLKTFRKINSKLQGHPDKNKIPGIDATSGSLGQGLSIANGMAIASKHDSLGCRVYCIIGDGESEEGQIWEAAMTANKYKLDNLCVILDYNNLQIDGTIEDVAGLDMIESKWESFGFNVIRCNGNNIDSLITSFATARNEKGKPSIIIANTVKGKGVSFMENKVEWHGKAPNEEQYNEAMNELNKNDERIRNS